MNNKGKGSGLALILILIVALIVAFLVVKNLSSLNSNTTQQEQDYIQQAQDAVDTINQKIQEAGQEP